MHDVDVHSHVLPGVDDGPSTLEGSLCLARSAVAAGTDVMVATPHVNESRFIDPGDISGAVADLNQALVSAEVPLIVRGGAEIALPRLLDLEEDELAGLGLGGSSCLLLESPLAAASGDFEPLIFDARTRGFEVLLAHPERCPAFQRDPQRLTDLVATGAMIQITAGALVGQFGGRARAFAFELLREGLVHVVASDAHDHERRVPGLSLLEASRELPEIQAHAQWLTRDAPTAILSGSAVAAAPRLADRAGWRRVADRLMTSAAISRRGERASDVRATSRAR